MSMHKSIKENITQYGLAVLGTEGFAYSIGRAKLGQPDLIICSKFHKTNHMLINMVHCYLADGGEIGVVNSLLEGKDGKDMPVEIVAIERDANLTSNYTVQNEHFYEMNPEYVKSGFEPCYLQVLIPDVNGKLPYEDGYDHKNLHQPMFKAKVMH